MQTDTALAETTMAGGEAISRARPRTSRVPAISIVVLNYNGAPWLERCLESIRRQTIFDELEIIVADNASPDHSALLAAGIMESWPDRQVIQHFRNVGYSEGNNLAAGRARGSYLFFLNNDTWLEPECLKHLLKEARSTGAAAATPLVMDYLDDGMQSAGGGGFDLFGLLCGSSNGAHPGPVFVASGCSLLIERELFQTLGGFDPLFFMYADEYDLCWRVWLSGREIIVAPSARMHHRGAAAVNPRGYQKVLEVRTSDTKRYFANRNNLLVLFKNCQHLLLALVPLQCLLLGMEALVMGAWTRRLSHVRRAYVDAVADCWRLRRHIFAERRRLRQFRKHGDFWMLRFLCGKLNRWEELRRFMRFGLPKVDSE